MDNTIVKIKEKLNYLKSSKSRNPHEHWSFLLGISLVLAFILILVSIYFLYEIKNEQIFKSSVNIPTKHSAIREDLLKNIKDSSDFKVKNQIDLDNNKTFYPDPSL